MKQRRTFPAVFGVAALLSLTFLGNPCSASPDDREIRDLQVEKHADRPWAEGVPSKEQKAAKQIFDDANTQMEKLQWRAAITEYGQALGHWDHPAIHYNMALAHLALEEPIEAHKHLEKAIAYGPDPLHEDNYRHAKEYLALVKKQLAKVEVSCDVPGAVVRMDRTVLFRAPGVYRGIVLRGEHTFTASRSGYVTRVIPRVLTPGDTNVVELRLYTWGQLHPTHRQFRPWIPLTATGAGTVLLGAGAFLTLGANNTARAYDREVDQACASPPCPPVRSATDLQDRANVLRTGATVSYVAGGAALATGLTLLLFNRKITEHIDPEELDRRFTLQPMAGPESAGVVGTIRF